MKTAFRFNVLLACCALMFGAGVGLRDTARAGAKGAYCCSCVPTTAGFCDQDVPGCDPSC